jgi:hypothetical protein
MSIIALCGFHGSGKDTLGNILVEKFGYTKLSFAGIVKDVVSIIFDWDRKLLEGDTKESRLWREEIDEWWSNRLNIPNLSPRWVLQNVGTDLFRNNFHQDIWVACLEKKISKLAGIVITDIRFENEINTIKKLGGVIIRVKDKNTPIWFEKVINGSEKPPSNIHPSEYSWIYNSPDYTIENTGTIKDLENKIISLLNKNI